MPNEEEIEEEVEEEDSGEESEPTEGDEGEGGRQYKKFGVAHIIIGVTVTFGVDFFSALLDGTAVGMIIAPVLQSVVSLWTAWWFHTHGSKTSMKPGRMLTKCIANFIPFIPTTCCAFIIEVWMHNHPKMSALALKVATKGKGGGKKMQELRQTAKDVQAQQAKDQKREVGNYKNFREFRKAEGSKTAGQHLGGIADRKNDPNLRPFEGWAVKKKESREPTEYEKQKQLELQNKMFGALDSSGKNKKLPIGTYKKGVSQVKDIAKGFKKGEGDGTQPQNNKTIAGKENLAEEGTDFLKERWLEKAAKEGFSLENITPEYRNMMNNEIFKSFDKNSEGNTNQDVIDKAIAPTKNLVKDMESKQDDNRLSYLKSYLNDLKKYSDEYVNSLLKLINNSNKSAIPQFENLRKEGHRNVMGSISTISEELAYYPEDKEFSSLNNKIISDLQRLGMSKKISSPEILEAVHRNEASKYTREENKRSGLPIDEEKIKELESQLKKYNINNEDIQSFYDALHGFALRIAHVNKQK